jgi:hypothetical protein
VDLGEIDQTSRPSGKQSNEKYTEKFGLMFLGYTLLTGHAAVCFENYSFGQRRSIRILE